jgi:hypothetical protein
MAVEGENILALTHRRASVRCGTVGCDASCRRVLWLWRGDRSGGVIVEVTVWPPVDAVRGEEGDAAPVGAARVARGQLCVPRRRVCRPGGGQRRGRRGGAGLLGARC